jgi:N6-L-threonylcarbamoyladenine synthase
MPDGCPPPPELVLGIESSCDETAAAVVRSGRHVLSSVVASQEEIHARFGGVVPEIASRKHSEVVTHVVAEALERAGVTWSDLSGIAVTNGPGLSGALLVGVAAAKGYALATGLPLVGVNHVEAHLLANFLCDPEAGNTPARDDFPAICLIVSGGHSDIVVVRELGDYQIIGWTRDDAAGEAMDKAARVLALGYPGGPAIDRAAREGDPGAVAFPRPVVEGTFDFSFSGLKTALTRFAAKDEGRTSVNDLAASFQEAVVDTLLRNTFAAAEQVGARQVLLAGGVAANSRLRARLLETAAERGLRAAFPAMSLCTDNAAMVAAAGYYHACRKGWDRLDLDVFSAMVLADHV